MKTMLKELKYSLYLMTHPFKGFWGLKHEKEGSLKSAFLLLALFLLSAVMNGLFVGYMFNPSNGVNFDIIRSIGMNLVTFFFWCIANWCLTCLFDGEGTFGDIIKATAYSLVPMVFTNLILIVVSQILSLREAAFYGFILTVGTIYTGLLIFISTVVTHQYTFFKTVAVVICIILGMCVLAYLSLLFMNLIQQMLGFVEVLFIEIQSNI